MQSELSETEEYFFMMDNELQKGSDYVIFHKGMEN